jgi:hypothetical protein
MPYFLSPIGNVQTIDANGDPLVGGTISTFLAGTSTPETTYTDDTGGTDQGVVMTLNSLGYPTNGPVWMLGGVPLKFIIKNALGVTQSTFDDISGIGDTSTAADQWVLYGAPPTYISATSFSVVGDQTNTFQVNRPLKSINGGGTVYSNIFTSVFAAGITTVTVTNSSGVLDSDLSAVSYSLLTADNQAIPAVSEAVNLQTGTTYIYAKGDKGKLVTHTNAAAIAGTLPVASTTGAGWWMDVQNRGAGVLTITPTTSTIDGATSLVLLTGQGIHLVSDGTNYYTQRGKSSTPQYIYIRDEKTSGTAGGSSTSGSWQTRTLNTEVADSGGNAALASNQVTLQPGTYTFRFGAPTYGSGRNKARLQNITAGTTVTYGTSEFSGTSQVIGTRSFGAGEFTISAATIFEVQHQVSNSLATEGYGSACSFASAVEVYTELEFWRTA